MKRIFFGDIFRSIFLVGSALSVLVAIILLGLSAANTKNLVTKNALDKQALFTKSAASSVQEFFIAREQRLLLLTTLVSIQDPKSPRLSDVLKNAMETLPASAVNIVSDIVRFDAEGEIIARGSGINEKNNISDRDYFLWAKDPSNRNKVFYPSPLTPRGGPEKGNLVFVIVMPVYFEDRFTGGVSMVISLNKLLEQYISELNVLNGAKSILIDSNKQFIIPGKEVLGEDELKILLARINLGSEGKLVISDKLVTFYPIKLADNKQIWTLVLVAPQTPELVIFDPFYKNLLLFFALLLLMIVIFFITLIFAVRLGQRDAYLDGFAQGRDNVSKNKRK